MANVYPFNGAFTSAGSYLFIAQIAADILWYKTKSADKALQALAWFTPYGALGEMNDQFIKDNGLTETLTDIRNTIRVQSLTQLSTKHDGKVIKKFDTDVVTECESLVAFVRTLHIENVQKRVTLTHVQDVPFETMKVVIGRNLADYVQLRDPKTKGSENARVQELLNDLAKVSVDNLKNFKINMENHSAPSRIERPSKKGIPSGVEDILKKMFGF